MHPWAADPETIGALAATQLAIFASRDRKKHILLLVHARASSSSCCWRCWRMRLLAWFPLYRLTCMDSSRLGVAAASAVAAAAVAG